MKNAIQNSQTPLLGTFDKLDDLFDTLLLLHVDQQVVPGSLPYWAASTYHVPPGCYPLSGLPGTVRANAAIFVRPNALIGSRLQGLCQNSIIGGFRIIRSAELMKHDLLPVYAFDYHRFVSILVAYVSYSEHERFNT